MLCLTHVVRPKPKEWRQGYEQPTTSGMTTLSMQELIDVTKEGFVLLFLTRAGFRPCLPSPAGEQFQAGFSTFTFTFGG